MNNSATYTMKQMLKLMEGSNVLGDTPIEEVRIAKTPAPRAPAAGPPVHVVAEINDRFDSRRMAFTLPAKQLMHLLSLDADTAEDYIDDMQNYSRAELYAILFVHRPEEYRQPLESFMQGGPGFSVEEEEITAGFGHTKAEATALCFQVEDMDESTKNKSPRIAEARAKRRAIVEDIEPNNAEDWPMLTDERNHPSWTPEADEGDYDETVHPVVAALQHGTVQSLEVVDEWRDDHAACLAIRAVIDDKTYEWSDWWLNSVGTRMYYRAEGTTDSPPRKAALKKLVNDHIAVNNPE